MTALDYDDFITAERCVSDVQKDGLRLTDINPMFTVDDIRESVEADFRVADELKLMEI